MLRSSLAFGFSEPWHARQFWFKNGRTRSSKRASSEGSSRAEAPGATPHAPSKNTSLAYQVGNGIKVW